MLYPKRSATMRSGRRSTKEARNASYLRCHLSTGLVKKLASLMPLTILNDDYECQHKNTKQLKFTQPKKESQNHKVKRMLLYSFKYDVLAGVGEFYVLCLFIVTI